MIFVPHAITGKLLRINLTDKTAKEETIPMELYKRFVGGRGLAAWYLWKETPPGVDPFSPENKMVWGTGPLTGLPIQTAYTNWVGVTKSPLTYGYCRNRCVSYFGVMMKKAGYDMIIWEGKAEKPTYVIIDDGHVSFGDATKLWGCTTDLTQIVMQEITGPGFEYAVIGPAAEKLVRYATVQSGTRSFGRGGHGAVMASKNLKAVAIRGTGELTMANPEKVRELSREQIKQLAASHGTKRMQQLGTTNIHGMVNKLGDCPYKNFQSSYNPKHEKIDEERIKYTVRHAGCGHCIISCWKYVAVKEGPYAGAWCEGPEYETQWAFGDMIDNDDFAAIIKANQLCDQYGIDTISTGNVVAFTMELYEKGILKKEDLDGLDLKWGNMPAVFELLKKIAYREGIGDILAEGAARAAKKIGKGAEKYAMVVKNMEMPGYEPRATVAHGFQYLTNTIGPVHSIGYGTQEVFQRPWAVDPRTFDGKGELTAFNQNRLAYMETVIWCTFAFRSEWHDPKLLAQIFAAATGWEEFSTVDAFMVVGERVWNLERAFNVREGLTRADEHFPDRIMEPIPDGPAKGCHWTRELENKLLDEYYKARGWDLATGWPTRAKLEQLGLKDVADELEKLGKLPK